ncbi:MAG: SCO family protein [Verrucomicrobiota bacterium]|jgi:protein SCO1/2
MRKLSPLCAFLACSLLPGCDKPAPPAPQTFIVNGVVKELEQDGKTVLIRHEAISNYMPAMTMPFEVRDTNQLRGLKSGDTITFQMVVTPTDGWIDKITKIAGLPAPASEPAAPPPIHWTRALEPLDEGDRLPDFQFTNELGQAVRLSQFRGQVLVLTFFFTSCPFPDFCPRMTSNFAEVEKKLAQMPETPAPWHLLSISFDPATDTPLRLAAYARAAGYDPRRWSFLTGQETNISGLADQLGENYWHEGAGIGHNLRTVVVDPKGRIRKILPGNKWTSDQLIQEMIQAARS